MNNNKLESTNRMENKLAFRSFWNSSILWDRKLSVFDPELIIPETKSVWKTWSWQKQSGFCFRVSYFGDQMTEEMKIDFFCFMMFFLTKLYWAPLQFKFKVQWKIGWFLSSLSFTSLRTVAYLWFYINYLGFISWLTTKPVPFTLSKNI